MKFLHPIPSCSTENFCFHVGDYSFGFNGKDKESEFNSGAYDFGARIHDARLGRFFIIDSRVFDFPSFSPYLFAANFPIGAIDKNGESVYVVIDGGEVVDINSPKASAIREKIGYNTLMKTTHGQDMLKRLENSTTIDVYITIDAFPKIKDADGNLTSDPSSGKTYFDPELRVKEKGSSISPKHKEIKAKNSRHVFHVSLNEAVLNSDDTYADASLLYHEAMAHIMMAWEVQKEVIKELGKASSSDTETMSEINKTRSRISHEKYGSYQSGYRGQILRKGSLAGIIKQQLEKLRNAEKSTSLSIDPRLQKTADQK